MSFAQGLSGLNASSKNLDVIGNNVANAGTYGAKSSRAEFGDVYAAALNGAGANPIGIGVSLLKVSQQFTQGNITTTSNPMDMAINGDGFFQLQQSQTDQTRSYTRNGQFKVDANGWIVNDQNQLLMCYPKPAVGQPAMGPAGPLQLETAGGAPQATTEVTMELNLDSTSTVKDTTASNTMDTANAGTFNNSTSTTVYDSRGQAVALTFYFQREASDPDGTSHWNVYATADGQPVGGGTTSAMVPLAPQLVFPPDGSAPSQVPAAFTIPAYGQHLAIPNIALNMGTSTQYGSAFGVTKLAPDGYAKGDLSGISVAKDGTLVARYTNGQTQVAGQVELARFQNPQGLQSLGGNNWAETAESGRPVLNVPGAGGQGVLQSGALEESNIDLTGELVNMITAQRIYQANAQTIKTEDQVMQTLVNLR